MRIRLKLQWQMMLLIGLTSLVVLALVGGLTYKVTWDIVMAAVEREMYSTAYDAAHQLDAYFNRIAQIPQDAAGVSSGIFGQPDYKQLWLDAMYPVIARDPDILNLYSAYEPGVLEGKEYALLDWRYQNYRETLINPPYNFPGEPHYDPSQPIYDYHNDESWYLLAKRAGTVRWGPPYFDPGATNAYVVSAVAPIYDGNTFVGVAGVDVTLEHLNQFLSELKIGESGYAFVVTADATYLAHPLESVWEDIKNGKTLFDLAEEKNEPGIHQVATEISTGQASEGLITIANPRTGGVDFTFHVPLKSTGWHLVLVFPRAEAMEQVYTLGWIVSGVVLLGFIVTAGAAFGIARSVAQPLGVIVRGAERLAVGDADFSAAERAQLAQIGRRNDELGITGRVFAELIEYFREMADVAQHISRGNVQVEVNLKGPKDIFGNAFTEMVMYIQAVAYWSRQLAQGDLTVAVDPQSLDDTLGQAFAKMLVNLRSLVGQVQRNAGEVTLAAQQITQSSEQSAGAMGQVALAIQQVARGAMQQTEQMGQTTAMVQQVSHAIEGVARGAQEQSVAVMQTSEGTVRISQAIETVIANAQTGVAGAETATRTAHAGAETIEATIQGMQTIKAAQDEARRKVLEMGARAEEIGLIVVTIEKIADQTNLLALNAAIEAARAGAHGKGFAVVADEVRRLAENAGNATQDIVALVKGIQKSVAEAVQAMEAGTTEVNTGVSRSRDAGKALNDILMAVGVVNQQMDDIVVGAERMNAAAREMVNAVETVSAVVEENTAATEQMASGAEEVLGRIEEIAGIAEESSASVEEVSASVEEVSAQAEEVSAAAETLREMAQNLQELVSKFQL